MTEKRMLIVDAEIARKIDENRGDLSCSEFLGFLVENRLKGESSPDGKYINREEFQQFSQGMKELLRNFLDFFISYGLELGGEPKDQTYDELCKKLQILSSREKTKEA